MQTFAFGVNLLALIGALVYFGFQWEHFLGHPEDAWIAAAVLAYPAINISALMELSSKSLVFLWFRRKALEEEVKINALESAKRAAPK